MYTLGAFLLLAALLGAVITVIDSVLDTLKVKATIDKLPVIGANWGLLIAILMMWLLDSSGVGHPASGWGIVAEDDWVNIVANGAMVFAAVPLLKAVIGMVEKGLRA